MIETIASQTYHGVRDWSVKARRKGDSVIVTVKVGTFLHSRVNLSVATWPNSLYGQTQAAAKALGDAIGIPEHEWTSCELSRIPREIVRAMNEVTL